MGRQLNRIVSVVYQMVDEHTEQEAYEYLCRNLLTETGENDSMLLILSEYALGYLFYSLSLYSDAILYFDKALDICKINNNSDTENSHIRQWIMLEQCYAYCASHDFTSAVSIMQYLDQSREIEDNDFIHHYVLLCAILAMEKNEPINVKKHIKKLEKLYSNADPLRHSMEYSKLTEYVVGKALNEQGKCLVEILNEFSEQTKSKNVKGNYLRSAIMYYGAINDKTKWIESFTKYEELEALRESIMVELKKNNIRNKEMLYHQKELKNKLLRRVQNMKDRAEIDVLTGLPNRYRLNSYGTLIYKKAIKECLSVGVMFMDIDNFKEYNDTYGHLAGDKCLKIVGKILAENIGDNFVARYGGDEFVAIFYNVNDEKISKIAENVREALKKQSYQINNELSSKDITMSQGMVNDVPKNGISWSDFIHAADTALYKVKITGRDKMYIANIGEY